MNGWTEKLPSGRYRARHRVKGVGLASADHTFKTKAAAEAWLIDQMARLQRGAYADPALGRTAFADWVPRWEAARVHLRPSSRAAADSLMRNHVLPFFGPLPVARVETNDVEAFVSGLIAKGLAPATVRQAYLVARGVFASAVRSKALAASPCQGVKLPRIERPELRVLSPAEIEDLAARVEPRYRALVLVGGYAGLRWGEAAALKDRRVNLLKRSLTVAETLSDVAGVVSFAEPKTRASRRRIALPRRLADGLTQHLEAFPPTRDDGLLFTGPAGGPLRRTNFRRRQWLPAVAAAGLEDVRFHDLRHSHVALLIDLGEHPKTIQGRLGHASISTTLDTYGHLFEGLDEAAAERLDAAIDPHRSSLSDIGHVQVR